MGQRRCGNGAGPRIVRLVGWGGRGGNDGGLATMDLPARCSPAWSPTTTTTITHTHTAATTTTIPARVTCVHPCSPPGPAPFSPFPFPFSKVDLRARFLCPFSLPWIGQRFPQRHTNRVDRKPAVCCTACPIGIGKHRRRYLNVFHWSEGDAICDLARIWLAFSSLTHAGAPIAGLVVERALLELDFPPKNLESDHAAESVRARVDVAVGMRPLAVTVPGPDGGCARQVELDPR